mgnify:FL=1
MCTISHLMRSAIVFGSMMISPAVMAQNSVFTVADDATLQLDGASSLTTANVDGTDFLFTTSVIDNGVSVFSIASNGALTNVFNVSDDATLNLAAAQSVVAIEIDGTDIIYVAGTGDDGISSFTVASNGALTNIENYAPGMDAPIRMSTAVVGGNPFLFVPEYSNDQIGVYAIANDGTLSQVDVVSDRGSFRLDGAAGTAVAVVDGTTFLIVAGQTDGGISVFSVDTDGTLTNTANVFGAELDGVRAVTAATVGGTTFVFGAGWQDDGVSIYSLANDGTLALVGSTRDNATLKLDGPFGIATLETGGVTYLMIGSQGDRGFSLFTVSDAGALTNIANVSDTDDLELNFVSFVDAAIIDGNPYFFVASDRDDGIGVFDIDTTAPRIASIERQTPASSPTNADSVTWRIVFAETVINVDTADFTVSGTTGTVTNVTNSSGNIWDVTVSGGDMADLDATITLGFAGGQDITDSAGNALTDTTPYGIFQNTYEIINDVTAPTVTSILRHNPTDEITREDTVTWQVNFSETVTGVDTSDFSLSGTTATVSSVSASSGSSIEVTASGGNLADGDLIVSLSVLASSGNIEDATGNDLTDGLPTGDYENYYVDNSPPGVDIIHTDDSANNANSLVTWDISFFENQSNLTIDDFTLETTGTVNVADLQISVDNGTSVQVTANLTGDGTAQLKFNANTDLVDDAGNGNGTNGYTAAYDDDTFSVVTVDNTAPTVNTWIAGASLPLTASAEMTMAFSEDVTGFTIDDIVVSGATLSGFRANNARFYFVTINRISDGEFTIDIPAGVATDDAGNPNEAAAQYEAAFDTTPPTVVLSTSASEPVSDSFFVINIDFSEDITGLNEGAFVIVNGSTNNLSGSDGAYTMEVRPTFGAAGTVTIDIPADTVQDAAGFGNEASNQLSVAFDREAPTLTSIERQTPGNENIGLSTTSVTFRATFSEDVTNVDVADWAIYQGGGGTIDSVTPVSASVYDIVYSLLNAHATIELGLSLSGDVSIEDTAGNALVNDEVTGTSETYFRDVSAPVTSNVEFVTTGGSPTSSDTLMWAISFNEDMANASADDFELSGTTATITGVSTPQASLVEVTASGGDLADLDSPVTLSLSDDSDLSDLVGNPLDNLLNSGTDERTVVVDNTSPVPAITAPAGPVSGTFGITITFNEAVSDFALGDVIVGNGTASNLQTSDNTTFTAIITPDRAANLTLDIAPGVASDAAGNDNLAASQVTTLYDLTPPTASISGPDGPVSGAFTLDIAFSETVTDFTADDVTVGNGSVTQFRAPRGGGEAARPEIASAEERSPITSGYLVEITPAADGPVTVDVSAGGAQDEAGNGNAAASQFSILADLTAPRVASIVRLTPTSSPTDADTLTWRVTFDEAVTGVDAGDFAVSGTTASVTGVTIDAGNAFDVTVSGGDVATINATVTLTVLTAGGIADAAGNAFAIAVPTGANDNTFVVINDREPPRIVSIEYEAPTLQNPTASDTLHWRVTFDEAITNLDVTDFAVTGTTAVPISLRWAQGNSWDITVSGGDLADLNGVVTFGLAADQNLTDLAGNALTDATPTGANINSFVLDNAGSAAVLARAGTGPVQGAFTMTVTFQEPVAELALADFSVTNATLSDLLIVPDNFNGWPAGYEASYTVWVTPDGDGTMTIGLSSGAAADIAGNGTLAAVPLQVTADSTSPRVASIQYASPTLLNPTGSDTLHWRVSFSEDVDNVSTGDFAVTGTTGSITSVTPRAVALPPSVVAASGGSVWAALAVSQRTFDLTVSGGDLAGLNGVVTLSFAPGQDIADLAGNVLENTAPMGTNNSVFVVDNTGPGVRLSTTAAAPVSGPFVLSVRFDEPVAGFEPGDLVIVNGSASDLSIIPDNLNGWPDGFESYYDITITPSGEGNVTINLGAGAASDLSGNGNLAASTLSILNDTLRALTVTLPGVGEGSVTSAPAGIDCGTDCSEEYTIGADVTLTAAAGDGSSFSAWTAGPCTGSTDASCAVTMSSDRAVTARFTLDTPPAGRIVASTLPGARSGHVGGPAMSAFLSVVSRTTSPAQSCTVAAPAGAPVTLNYRQVDASNTAIGPLDPLFDIPAGGTLSFVLELTPAVLTEAGGYEFLPVITCENASLDPIVGVNSVLLNIGAAPTPDILSSSATPSGDGVIRIPAAGGVGIMSAAALNIGVGDGSGGPNDVTVTVTADTGAAVLPVMIELCPIDAATAACLSPRAASVTVPMSGSTPLFFAAFIRDTSTGGIAFDPANARVFLRFADATGAIRTATSAAVTAPAPEASPEIAASLPAGRWSVLVRQPAGIWPGLARASLYVTDSGLALLDTGETVRAFGVDGLATDDPAMGRFRAASLEGQWRGNGAIRLGAPWATTTGELWGARDARSNGPLSLSELTGSYGLADDSDGQAITLAPNGTLSGTLAGCIVSGSTTAHVGTGPVYGTVSFMACSASGSYVAAFDTPANDTANDNQPTTLIIANGERGWRLER